MTCKNCENTLRTDYSFCPDCGAKVIRNRITIKNLWFDIIERYFNIDNTLLRTMLHLFTKPEAVIDGYIQGTRKKYLNPISYLGIALTISGILVFIMQKFFSDAIDFSAQTTGSFGKKWGEIVFDYNAFFFLLYFPVLAIPGYLLLNKIKYNLSEYVLVFVYTMSHFSIATFLISFIILLSDSSNYMIYSQLTLIFLLVYNVFVAQRLNRHNVREILWRGTIFSILVTIFFIIAIIGLMAVLLIVGVFELKDFVPQP